MRAWHEGGAAAGDLAFWRQHVEQFRSPKAYALVIETLLDHRDPVAAMALLVQWLSQAEEIPLVEEDYSFHDLALLWMEDLWQSDAPTGRTSSGCRGTTGPPPSRRRRRPLHDAAAAAMAAGAKVSRLPRSQRRGVLAGAALRDGRRGAGRRREHDRKTRRRDEEDEDDEDNLFGAAYEDVTYRDSTDDGVEGEMFETGESATDFELVGEAERIVNRLSFLTTVAQLWKLCATASLPGDAADRDDVLAGWLAQADRQPAAIAGAAGVGASASDSAAARHAGVAGRIRPPAQRQGNAAGGDHRGVRRDGRRRADDPRVDGAVRRPPPRREAWERQAGEVLAAVLRGDVAGVRRVWPKLLRTLAKQPLLYVALGRGGNPQRIVASRSLQYVLRRLLSYLPRLGLLTETCRLLETAQRMETEHPVGPGGDHRVRPRVRDRLQGHHAVPGRLVGRLARREEERRACRSRQPTAS